MVGNPVSGNVTAILELNLKSYQMPTYQIIWCAQSSWHYVVEGSMRYAMPLYLAIQAKEHLKTCPRSHNDCVAQWVSALSPADRIQVKIVDHRVHVSY